MSVYAGDVATQSSGLRGVILCIYIVEISRERHLGIDDEFALRVEVKNHIGAERRALVGLHHISGFIANNKLSVEVDSIDETLRFKEFGEDRLAPVALHFGLVAERISKVVGTLLSRGGLLHKFGDIILERIAERSVFLVIFLESILHFVH